MKFINEKFDWATGKTTVTLADKYGIYIGTATLAPEDKYNHIFGGNIAEQRAVIKKLKEDIKRYRAMLHAIKNLKKDIDINCKYDSNLNMINKRINLAIRNYTKEIENLKEQIVEVKENIKKSITLRDNIIKGKTK